MEAPARDLSTMAEMKTRGASPTTTFAVRAGEYYMQRGGGFGRKRHAVSFSTEKEANDALAALKARGIAPTARVVVT